MIPDAIAIQNFGVYVARQEIVLTPEPTPAPTPVFGGKGDDGLKKQPIPPRLEPL